MKNQTNAGHRASFVFGTDRRVLGPRVEINSSSLKNKDYENHVRNKDNNNQTTVYDDSPRDCTFRLIQPLLFLYVKFSRCCCMKNGFEWCRVYEVSVVVDVRIT